MVPMRLIDDQVPLYPDTNGTSTPILHLPASLEIEVIQQVKRAKGSWFRIRLPDKTTGFIPSDANLYQIQQIKLLDLETPLYADPTARTASTVLKRHTLLTSLDKVTVNGVEWRHVQEQSGNKGFIPGSANANATLPAIEVVEYVKSPVALRNIVIGALVTGVGAFITIGSYRAADKGGGNYMVMYGALIFGLAQLITGITQLFRGYR